jgi:hypothetical protein
MMRTFVWPAFMMVVKLTSEQPRENCRQQDRINREPRRRYRGLRSTAVKEGPHHVLKPMATRAGTSGIDGSETTECEVS